MFKFFKRRKKNKKKHLYDSIRKKSWVKYPYPDLLSIYEAYKEDSRMFISLEDVINDEIIDENYTKGNLLKKENNNFNFSVCGDMAYIPCPYFPIDEYTLTDEFFTTLDDDDSNSG